MGRALTPDDRVFAVGDIDGSVQLWNISDPAAVAAWICTVVGQPLIAQEWNQYLPDRPYTPPCR